MPPSGMMQGKRSTSHHLLPSLWSSSSCSTTSRSEGGRTSRTQEVWTRIPFSRTTAYLPMRWVTPVVFSTPWTLHQLRRPRKRNLLTVKRKIALTTLLRTITLFYRIVLILSEYPFLREISNVGIPGVYCSTQRDWKRAIWQPLAAHLRPMAQHHHPNTEGLLNPFQLRWRTCSIPLCNHEFERFFSESRASIWNKETFNVQGN